MKAKELAKQLMKHPDEEVRLSTKKNPPRNVYTVGGVEKSSLGMVIYAGE